MSGWDERKGNGMENKLEISEAYLDQILKASASSLVGEIMKRFEILENKDAVKADTKELVYEKFRELKGQIKAFNSGVKFIAPKSTC